MLKFKDCNYFEGLKLIIRDNHKDSRGEFYKIFNFEDMKNFGWQNEVQQINYSQTYTRGTVRGMHMQFSKYSEYKLVTCIKGSIFDVAIDLRQDSKSFLKYYSIHPSLNNFYLFLNFSGNLNDTSLQHQFR